MEQYIKKSVVKAEIEKRIEETKGMQPKFDQFWAGQISAFKGVLKILDTLQKPIKWSKEDENVISLILSICNDFLKSFKISPASTKVVKKDVDKIENWLKSLRPQNRWKPSEAQMDSITCAVRKMKESACYDSELVSLFNDLKKLKEE